MGFSPRRYTFEGDPHQCHTLLQYAQTIVLELEKQRAANRVSVLHKNVVLPDGMIDVYVKEKFSYIRITSGVNYYEFSAYPDDGTTYSFSTNVSNTDAEVTFSKNKQISYAEGFTNPKALDPDWPGHEVNMWYGQGCMVAGGVGKRYRAYDTTYSDPADPHIFKERPMRYITSGSTSTSPPGSEVAGAGKLGRWVVGMTRDGNLRVWEPGTTNVWTTPIALPSWAITETTGGRKMGGYWVFDRTAEYCTCVMYNSSYSPGIVEFGFALTDNGAGNEPDVSVIWEVEIENVTGLIATDYNWESSENELVWAYYQTRGIGKYGDCLIWPQIKETTGYLFYRSAFDYTLLQVPVRAWINNDPDENCNASAHPIEYQMNYNGYVYAMDLRWRAYITFVDYWYGPDGELVGSGPYRWAASALGEPEVEYVYDPDNWVPIPQYDNVGASYGLTPASDHVNAKDVFRDNFMVIAVNPNTSNGKKQWAARGRVTSDDPGKLLDAIVSGGFEAPHTDVISALSSLTFPYIASPTGYNGDEETYGPMITGHWVYL